MTGNFQYKQQQKKKKEIKTNNKVNALYLYTKYTDESEEELMEF